MGELLAELKQVPKLAALGVMTDIWLVLACVFLAYDKPVWTIMGAVLCAKAWVFMRAQHDTQEK